MDELAPWLLPLLLFSLRTSSSLDSSSMLTFFLLFFFLCRGGSFLGKVNMGKMTSSMATAHSRNPLHLGGGGMPNTLADEAGVALIDGDGGLWVHVKADEDSSQEVTGRWTQCSHHVHDG
ncbi:hypothetical protein EYF80_051515 [Liparis tanakae]|uniref:Uncharacterized protein n=1 Tax=Liparis tanakae TaxID=230148 RepID=A0A4Z2FC34_9TELE|nr:hypothetical protein EYF80_051515 [Liparis tanakae]